MDTLGRHWDAISQGLRGRAGRIDLGRLALDITQGRRRLWRRAPDRGCGSPAGTGDLGQFGPFDPAADAAIPTAVDWLLLSAAIAVFTRMAGEKQR